MTTRAFTRRSPGQTIGSAHVNELQAAIEQLSQITGLNDIVAGAADGSEIRIPGGTARQRLKTRNDGNIAWVDEPVLYLDDFGAFADGVTDDGPALSAAYTAAALAVAESTYAKATIELTPGKRYRIASTVQPKANVRIRGYGAKLLGPITGFPRIGATEAASPPSATDVAGQIGGACFADNGAGTLYGLEFEGIAIAGFRFGFVSLGGWNTPIFKDVEWTYCDAGVFSYQGCQHYQFINPMMAQCGVLIIAAATCYAAGNPYAGLDNFFCDGLRIRSYRATITAIDLPNFNTWFNAAILRPATPSAVSGGPYTFLPTGTFLKPTGRIVYVPSRNHRNIFSMHLEDVLTYDCPRGIALLRNPYNCLFRNMGGEQNFSDVAVNTGPDESTIVVGVGTNFANATFESIDADTTGTIYPFKGAVDIVHEATTWNTHFVGIDISGAVNPADFVHLTSRHLSGGNIQSRENVGRTLHTYPVSQDGRITDGGAWYLKPSPGANRSIRDNNGMEIREQALTGRIPNVDGLPHTYLQWGPTGSSTVDSASHVIKGTLDLFIERLDTFETDSANYDVVLFQRFATPATTFAVAGTIGQFTITLPNSAAAVPFSPGSTILVNGADKYGVLSVSGAVLTLPPAKALTANYAIGTTVVATSTIVRTNKALVNAWVTVSISGNMLKVLSNLGTTIPINAHGVFTYPRFVY